MNPWLDPKMDLADEKSMLQVYIEFLCEGSAYHHLDLGAGQAEMDLLKNREERYMI